MLSLTSCSVSVAGAVLRESVPPPPAIVPRSMLMRELQQSMLVASTPLNVKLLLVTRPPLTLGLTLALLFDSRLLISAETPGSINSNCVKLREEVGRFSKSRSSSSRTIAAEFLTTMSASAVTTMVSVWGPTVNSTGTKPTASVLTLIPS